MRSIGTRNVMEMDHQVSTQFDRWDENRRALQQHCGWLRSFSNQVQRAADRTASPVSRYSGLTASGGGSDSISAAAPLRHGHGHGRGNTTTADMLSSRHLSSNHAPNDITIRIKVEQ